jgi:hypothetical protein
MGLRAVPLLTLFLVIPIVLSQLGGSGVVHAIQTGSHVDPIASDEKLTPIDPAEEKLREYQTPQNRPTLEEAFKTWNEKFDNPGGSRPEDANDIDCTVGTGLHSYRPLVLVAAQGGGIRAATWTVDVMRKFLVESACSREVVLMSSGASGGSVGLTMFQSMLPETNTINTRSIGEPPALAVGLSGTLVSDVLATTTGLRSPSQPGYITTAQEATKTEDAIAADWVWQDRAALIQAAWATRAPQLARAFDFDAQSPTGLLIFNSTIAGASCRAVVSQLDLGIGKPDADRVTGTIRAGCSEDTPPVSNMIDIQDYCPLDIDWATATMFSARFPIVTPAARIPADEGSAGCQALSELQFADGGYAENSGLGTLSDLAPELAALVAAENAKRNGPPIVPMVLYIRNEVGADVTAPSAAAASELLVPFLALNTKEALTSDNAWLQRLSDSLESVCDPAHLPCVWGVEAAREQVAGGVAVAAPSTRPAVIPPLGWTLSDTSRVLLSVEADAQMSLTCQSERDTSYGRLGDLMNTLATDPLDCKELVALKKAVAPQTSEG